MATEIATSLYPSALAKAKADLKLALQEQRDIEERSEELKTVIVTLRRVVSGLADLCGESSDIAEMGLTEACWSVLSEATHMMTAHQIIAEIEALGIDLSKQKNAMASVLSVLQRMKDANKIGTYKFKGDNRTYWKGPKSSLAPKPTDDDIPF